MSRLDGPWELRVVGESTWRATTVPGCWEDSGIAKDFPGQVEYRTTFCVPSDLANRRILLRFGAVSYACQIAVDGIVVGRHVGMWDAFEVDITPTVTAGGTSTLSVRVEKPASMVAGPDSAVVPGNYPVNETLSGFLPYVWGNVHGGIWQPVELIVRGAVVPVDVYASGTADGVIRVRAGLTARGRVALSVLDPAGRVVCEANAECGQSEADPAAGTAGSSQRVVARPQADDSAVGPGVEFAVRVPYPECWSPSHPGRYTVRLRTDDAEATVQIGLRDISVDGATIRLGDEPVYPRMILSWGWYPDLLSCDPGPERVRADLLELRRLGFNGVKLCLWFPPQYYFDIADELGLLLWVELPMWLPKPTAAFRRQVFVEVERLVRAARNHPSVVLWTLGCELGAAIGDDLLAPLYAMVKDMVGDALVRDNSGSGEAYGGLLAEHADFYDHHFYCEPQHFRDVLNYFAPQWRPEKPWLFGEFCDLDTFRDLRKLGESESDRPWWASADRSVSPQGARWQYDIGYLEERLRANGFWERAGELRRISHNQALLQRRVTLEAVRSRADTSGYVITGERDTPISTAGIWDDHGCLKFDPVEFAAFNSDLVLTLGWDRRRDWVAGGDRPAYWDTWCYQSGAKVRAHLVLANHGRAAGRALVDWEIRTTGTGAPFATGSARTTVDSKPGTVREVLVAEFDVPELDRPIEATLQATGRVGTERTSNSWRLWFFPRISWPHPLVLIDPAGGLSDLPTLGVQHPNDVVGGDSPNATVDAVMVATSWTAPVHDHVNAGGNAILLLTEPAEPSPCPIRPMPFWREAVKVIEPHEAWGDFPHAGWVDLQFAGCAADSALDTSALPAGVRPLLRRVDARTGEVHDYAAEIGGGAGRLIVATLRFAGGLGDQPVGIARNTGAAYLLNRWIDALSQTTVAPGNRPHVTTAH